MKRSKLEMLSTLLRDYTFEEVVPSNIMDSKITDSGEVEYLVEWMDGTRCSFKYHYFKKFCSQGFEESWVSELDVSDDLIRDYNDGLELASCKKIFDSIKRNELLIQVSVCCCYSQKTV